MDEFGIACVLVFVDDEQGHEVAMMSFPVTERAAAIGYADGCTDAGFRVYTDF